MDDGVLEVAGVDEALGDELLHAGGVGSEDGELVEGIVGELAVDALRKEEDIHVVRIGGEQGAQHGGGVFEITLLVVEIGELDAKLKAELRVVEFGEGVFHVGFGGGLAEAVLADAEQSPCPGEGRRAAESSAKMRLCSLAVAVEEGDGAEVGMCFHAGGVDLESGGESAGGGCGIAGAKSGLASLEVGLELRGGAGLGDGGRCEQSGDGERQSDPKETRRWGSEAHKRSLQRILWDGFHGRRDGNPEKAACNKIGVRSEWTPNPVLECCVR
jgi:hypothetical protein